MNRRQKKLAAEAIARFVGVTCCLAAHTKQGQLALMDEFDLPEEIVTTDWTEESARALAVKVARMTILLLEPAVAGDLDRQ